MSAQRRSGLVALVGGLFLALSGCSSSPSEEGSSSATLKIVAGSENKSLEPLVQRFCAERKITCSISYKGSLDIGLMTAPGGSDKDFDAVWPASSIWIDLYDTGHSVSHLKSIYQTPVILGVEQQRAKALGWIGKPVTMGEIVAATEAGKLPFLMSSATQSNSGASAYMSMLTHALGGQPTAENIESEEATAKIKSLMSKVERSSGSSGWLKDLYVENAKQGKTFAAMWNYEFLIREANQELAAAGKAPMVAIYPVDGMVIADSPLGFVDHGRGPEIEADFNALQAWLLDPKNSVRDEIRQTGRRIGGATVADAGATTAWNWQPAMTITNIGMPEPSVIRAALARYQEVLRKPSLTVFCMDRSGSMDGDGITQLKAATNFMFDPKQTAAALVQWSASDQISMIPFDGIPGDPVTAKGDGPGQALLMQASNDLTADGGTDMYSCGRSALDIIRQTPNVGQYLPAIIMMTDGQSDDHRDDFVNDWNQGGNIPVFGVTFGDADQEQLDELAKLTGGRVFDGKKNLAEAFRATRGYN